MKSFFTKSTIVIILLTGILSSCASGKPSLCDCLKAKGDLPSGCEQVFNERYGTTEPSTSQMSEDYYNCK